MPYTAQDHINSFLISYPGCSASLALKWLNEVDEEILAAVPLRRSYDDLALTAGVSEYDLDEAILRIWGVQLYTDAVNFHKLEATDVDWLDLEFPNWRTAGTGTIAKWYETASMTSGQIGLTPAPSASTLRVSNATAPGAITITTSTPHGLSNGTLVRISQVGGVTAANGLFYAKTVSFPSNQFALFSDAAMTVAVTSPAATYTASTGLIAAPGSPKLVLECSKRTPLLTGTNMPASPALKSLYSDGMAMLWAKLKRPQDYEFRRQVFLDGLGRQSDLKMKRQGRKGVSILAFRQRRRVWR